MKINWKIRFKNQAFLIAMIPLVFVLIQSVLEIFGISIPAEMLSEKLITIVKTVFTILGLLGVVVDPTTEGVQDSDRAMTYK